FFFSSSHVRENWLSIYRSLSQDSSIFPGIPVLHMFSYFGIAPIVAVLLEKKSDFWERPLHDNELDDIGETALHLALKHGHDDVIKILLLNGADSNAKCRCITLNFLNIHGDNNSVCQSLNHIDRKYGFFALHWACYHGYGAAAELLLNHGADINALSACFAWNIVHIMGDRNHVDQLISSASAMKDLRRQTEVGFSTLHLAALRGHEAIVKLLLDRGVDINANVGLLPMQITLLEGDGNMVKQSLEVGSGANCAILRGDQNRINQLNEALEIGPGYNSINIIGDRNSPQQLALRNTYGSTNVNAGNGCSSVYLAALNGHKAVTNLLLDRGAETNGEFSHNVLASTQSAPEPSVLINKLPTIRPMWSDLPQHLIIPFLGTQSFTALNI
ncbi:ankyrin repeat-containing domain protein, partial [Trichoderma chlorosporum]